MNMRLSAAAREQKIKLHCATLAKVVESVRPTYLAAAEAQKALIETMIGAAIWYIPKPANAWTGQISIAVLKAFHPDSGVLRPRISEEHVYPRKVAAKQLLETDRLDGDSMLDAFTSRYARVHYITPDENKVVTRFQRTSVFKSPEEAYRLAGISFISISEADLRKIKRRDKAMIESLLQEANHLSPSTPPSRDSHA